MSGLNVKYCHWSLIFKIIMTGLKIRHGVSLTINQYTTERIPNVGAYRHTPPQFNPDAHTITVQRSRSPGLTEFVEVSRSHNQKSSTATPAISAASSALIPFAISLRAISSFVC